MALNAVVTRGLWVILVCQGEGLEGWIGAVLGCESGVEWGVWLDIFGLGF